MPGHAAWAALVSGRRKGEESRLFSPFPIFLAPARHTEEDQVEAERRQFEEMRARAEEEEERRAKEAAARAAAARRAQQAEKDK